MASQMGSNGNSFLKLFSDPPPAYAFELSEAGIAFAAVKAAGEVRFQALEPGVIWASPARENISQPEALEAGIRAVSPPNGHRKRRTALILPDYCARVAVLDFDAFPPAQEEQLALLRFRLKKSVPFDIESAVLSYFAQRSGKGQIEVVAAVVACEIIARYEAPFRQSGFHPGFITTSSLAALNMFKPDKVSILAKQSGRTLSVLVLDGSTLKLARCVELESDRPDEIESILHPTFAYIEDELKSKPSRVVTCGFGRETDQFVAQCESEWGVTVEPLRSRFGTPSGVNAGLLGYLESIGN